MQAIGGRAALGLAVVLVAAVTQAGWGDVPPAPRTAGDVSPLPVLGPAPGFALRSLEGPMVRLRDLRGKLLLLAFVCATCPEDSEDLAAAFAHLQARLKTRGVFGTRVALAFVVRHPERDTRSAYRAYAGRLGVDAYGWAILSGSAEATRRLREGFGRLAVPPRAPPAEVRGRVFLIDYAGRLRRIYSAEDFRVDTVMGDLERLL